jgi:hypothetical protein
MFEQDYVLRIAKQLADALARIMRLRSREEEVLREVDAACGDLLGLPPGALDRLDAPTLIRLLKSPELAQQLADLVDEEAAARERLGQPETAARRRRLAAALRVPPA